MGIEENNTEEQCSSSPLYPACRLHLAAETVDNAIKPSGGGREVMVLGCILRLGNTLTNRENKHHAPLPLKSLNILV